MEILQPYRARIDALDDQIIDLLIQRTDIIREVGNLKYEQGIPAVLQDRVDEVRENAAARAEQKGLDPELVRRLYRIIIGYSCDLEEEIKAQRAEEDKKQGAAG